MRAVGVACAFLAAVFVWPLISWGLGGFEYSGGGVPGAVAALLGRLLLIAINWLAAFGPAALLAILITPWLRRRDARAGRAQSLADPAAAAPQDAPLSPRP